MPAIAPNIRQRLLCRSDLHAMDVDGERIAQWLRSEQLVFLGHVDAEGLPGVDAVYATDDETLRDELREILTLHGREDVVLATDEARGLLGSESVEPAVVVENLELTPAASAAHSGDMISEHVVEEGLDETIAEITEAIDDLLVSTDNAPLDLRDDAPLHSKAEDVLDCDVVEVEPAQFEETVDAEGPGEFRPDDADSAAAQAMHDWTAQTTFVDETTRVPPDSPADYGIVLDAEPVTDALHQILDAVRELSERQLPQPDFAPINQSLQEGVRSLRATIAKSTNHSHIDERLDRIHDALLDAVEAIHAVADVEARRRVARSTRNARRVGATASRFSLATTRENVGGLLAAASSLIGWSAAAWLYPADGKLALGALVCANLVACAALLARRPTAK